MQEIKRWPTCRTRFPATSKRYCVCRAASDSSAGGAHTPPPSSRVCVCCGAVTRGVSRDREVHFCPGCLERSHEQVGRDYDAAELGRES